MFIGFLIFVGFAVLALAAIVALVATVISSAGFGTILLAMLALAALPVVVLLAIGRAASRTFRPVRDLINAAGSLAEGDYSARVAEAGSPSIRPVTQSFNEMARRLETADELRRQLLADVGHELRTPLTVIRGEVEAMRDGVHEMSSDELDSLLAEVGVMERLLEDLRTLSMVDAGALTLHPEPTDISALLFEVAESHRRRLAESDIEIEIHAADAPEVVIDPVRIREVVNNLVVNAARALPDGGTIELRTARLGEGVVMEVADDGVGIEQAEIERVFDRFHKGSNSSGSGLGLSISRDLIEAHGGRIEIESEAGGGTVVRVDLSEIRPR